MRKASVEGITISLILSTIVLLVIGIVLSLSIRNFSINNLLFISIILVLATISSTMFVVIKVAREKRANRSDSEEVTTVTKDITARFILREGTVTIEAPDAESAMKLFQEIHENVMKHENLLKAESQGTMEETKPEAPDVPETKENEE